jgi:alpha-tubulin suppressor-like RCC1 family protein
MLCPQFSTFKAFGLIFIKLGTNIIGQGNIPTSHILISYNRQKQHGAGVNLCGGSETSASNIILIMNSNR